MREPADENVSTPSFPTSAERALGTVERVDAVGREIAVQLPTGLAVFDVPANCPILLHGERVKLRMVQPRDRVRIQFARERRLFVAKLVEVQPERGLVA